MLPPSIDRILFTSESVTIGATLSDGGESLTVVIPILVGDYNSDGTVNAADFTIWRDHLNQNFQLANEGGITPGVVNQADYNFWKSRFGATTGAGSASLSAAVPEPAAWIVAMAVAVAQFLWHRPKR